MAPLDGEVISISALEGQSLTASQQATAILRIAQLDPMTVWALVPEADVSRLTAGQGVYFTLLGPGERRRHGRLRQNLPAPQVFRHPWLLHPLFQGPKPPHGAQRPMNRPLF